MHLIRYLPYKCPFYFNNFFFNFFYTHQKSGIKAIHVFKLVTYGRFVKGYFVAHLLCNVCDVTVLKGLMSDIKKQPTFSEMCCTVLDTATLEIANVT